MADTVRIEPKPAAPAGKQYMQVDHNIVNVDAGDVITFYNALEPALSDVTIKFYPYDEAKTDANAIAGFCTSMGASKEFGVDKGTISGGTFTPGEAECEVAATVSSSTYQYSIDPQAGAWVDMDPVIIIEGGGGIVPMLPGFFAALIGVAIGAAAMRYVTSRREKEA